jgi:hypothetical protein
VKVAKKGTPRPATSRSIKKGPDSDPDHSTDSAKAFGCRLIAFAEQVGRMTGTVQGKADALLDREALHHQLSRIRESTATLLDHLAGAPPPPDDRAQAPPDRPPNGRSRGVVDAPGKKHRKAPALHHGIAHSDERIAKAIAARARRPQRRG